MDFNLKYSEHQKALLNADATTDAVLRALYLDRAAILADEIALHQSRLGAAAACAWSALMLAAAPLANIEIVAGESH